MANARQPIELAPNLTRALARVRGTLRKYIYAKVLLTIACWLLCVFWIGGLVDYLPVRVGSNETPRWVRIGMLVAMAAGSLWMVLAWGLPRLLAHIRNRSLALLIEKHYPVFNNELVTAVELSENSALAGEVSNAAAHRRMLERVHRSLWRQIGLVNSKRLFNWQPIWSLATAALIGSALTGVAIFTMPAWLELWSRRLFALSDQTWPRQAELRADGVQLQLPAFSGQLATERTTLAFEEDLVRVPRGATVLLKVSAEATKKIVPDVCTLFYRSADGERGRANLRRIGKPDDGWQQFALDGPPLDGVLADMYLDVVGLDARLRDLQLKTVEPAVITSMDLGCNYPAYLLSSASGVDNPVSRPAEEVLPYRSGMRIPEGTHITLLGEANTPLSKVEYVVRSAGSGSSGTNSGGVNSAKNGGDEGDVASSICSVPPDGKRFKIELGSMSVSQVVEVRLFDEFGLCSEQIPRYVLAIQADTIPEVATQLEGIGNAITSKALLPVTGKITDDNAIAAVQLEIARSDESVVSIDLELIQGERLNQKVDLISLAEQRGFLTQPGEAIGLVVTARDYFDLNAQAHVGRGQPQLLSVVNDDELLVILDRQELELRQRLERIIAELEQLREALQLLATAETLETTNTTNAHTRFISFQDDEQERRILVFRAQQSVLQGDKSAQELAGVASRVENIRMQLENNRIDSYDRQERLRAKVFLPLSELLAGEFQNLMQKLLELQTATLAGDGNSQAKTAISAIDAVLIELESIRDSMLDIESFNEIIELVRGLLDDQDNLIKETEEAQKQRILELLK